MFEKKKLSYVMYLLFGEAKFWWVGARQMKEVKAKEVCWESFKIWFLEKYFRNSSKIVKK